MKIIKNKLKEAMTPNERLFFLLGKGEGDKATDLMASKVKKLLRKKISRHG